MSSLALEFMGVWISPLMAAHEQLDWREVAGLTRELLTGQWHLPEPRGRLLRGRHTC